MLYQKETDTEEQLYMLISIKNKEWGESHLKKKKDEVTIRSSAAEYLNYVATVGD